MVHWNLRLKIKHTCLYTYTHISPQKRSIKYISHSSRVLFFQHQVYYSFLSTIIPSFCFICLKGSVFKKIFCVAYDRSLYNLQGGKPDKGENRKTLCRAGPRMTGSSLPAASRTAGGAHNALESLPIQLNRRGASSLGTSKEPT